MNRTALIKIASQLDYDLSPKQKDAEGNYIKRLVPTDRRRTPNPSIGEVQYKQLPDFLESKQNFNNLKTQQKYSLPFDVIVPPTIAGPMVLGMGTTEKNDKIDLESVINLETGGFNRLRRQGIITPIPRKGTSYIYEGDTPGGVDIIPDFRAPYPLDTKYDLGMLDLDKARVRQLAGDNPSPRDKKLVEAIVRKGAERARQARYNLLSDEGKKAYDAMAKYYGHNPHYSTISLPVSLSQTWGNQKVSSPDVLYSTADGGYPVAYDTKANIPGYKPGDTKFLLDRSVYDKDGNINKTILDNPYVRDFAGGKVMVQNAILSDPYRKAPDPQSNPAFLNIPIDKDKPKYKLTLDDHFIPGISLNTSIGKFDGTELRMNDFGSSDAKNNKTFGWPFYNLDVLDHEAKHTMNSGDVVEKAKKIKEQDNKSGLDKLKDIVFGSGNDSPLLKDTLSGESNGFVPNSPGLSYMRSGRLEHQRAMADLKGFVENYLKETIPAQMEARGELAGMTEDQQIDAISDRILDLANNKKVFLDILRNHNIIGADGSGVPNWFMEDSALGGTSRREAHRSIHGFWKSTPSKENLKQHIRPEDRQFFDNPGDRDYRPAYEKWVEEILPMIVNNSKGDATHYSSVLA